MTTCPLLLASAQTYDQHILFYLSSVFATVVGAIAGATASSRVRMDIFGILMCGTITSLGGGTVRDMLLMGMERANGSQMTVYWVIGPDVEFLYEALLTSVAVFYITRFVTLPAGTIRISDAFSMAFFSLLGAAKSYFLGCPWIVCVCMGVCTGVVGGVLRDVLTGNVPYVFRSQEVYASASGAGCLAFVALMALDVPVEWSFCIGTAVVFITRMAAVYLNWKVPSYRPLFDPHSHETPPTPPDRLEIHEERDGE